MFVWQILLLLLLLLVLLVLLLTSGVSPAQLVRCLLPWP
jgi:hypothetical protein